MLLVGKLISRKRRVFGSKGSYRLSHTLKKLESDKLEEEKKKTHYYVFPEINLSAT